MAKIFAGTLGAATQRKRYTRYNDNKRALRSVRGRRVSMVRVVINLLSGNEAG